MKKQIALKFLAAMIVSSTLLLACNKDEPAIPDKVKKVMYDWKITNITTPKKNEPDTDSSLLQTCMSDDIIKFTSAGFDFQDSTNKCDSTIFFYSKGVWAYSLVSDSIQLAATTPAKYMSWKVVTLNDSVMQVKYVDSSNAADKITKTISFKH